VKKYYLILLPVTYILVACNAAPAVTPEVTAESITPTIKSSPMPTLTFTSTSTNTPTSTLTPTLPSAILTPIPDQSQVINATNVNQLTEIATWGDGQLYSLRLTSDGKKIVAILSTGVLIFDSQSLEELSHVDIPIPDQFGVGWAVSPNGERLIILAENTTLTTWQLTTGNKLGSISFNDQYLGCAYAPENYVFSADNNTLGIFGECGESGILKIIRTSDQKILLKFEGKGSGLFSPDGKYLVTYGTGWDHDYNVKLWQTSDGQLLHDFGSEKAVGCARTYWGKEKTPWPTINLWGNETSCVAFSPDSTKLAISYLNATHLYNVVDGSEFGLFPSGRPWFSADGQILFRGTGFLQSTGYDLTNKKTLNFSTELGRPTLSPDGDYLTAIWTVNKYTIGGLILRDIKLGKDIARFPDYFGSVFSPDGKYVAMYAEKKPTILIRVSTGEILLTLNDETSPNFLQESKSLMTLRGDQLIVRNVPDGEIKFNLKDVGWPQVLPDGQSILTLEGNTIYRRSTTDGKVFVEHSFPVSPESIFYTGTNIIETSLTGTRVLALPQLTYQEEYGPNILFSPDNSHYIVQLTDGFEIWRKDESTGPQHFIPTGGQDLIVYSPYGDLAAIDKTNGELEVRNVETGELIQALQVGISKTINNIAISPDLSRIYIVTKQGLGVYTLTGWKLKDGSPLPSQQLGCNSPIFISPDSRLLAFFCNGGKKNNGLSIVQIRGWMPLHGMENIGGSQISFSPDSKLIAVTSSNSGDFRIWDVENARLLKTIVDNQLAHSIFEGGGVCCYHGDPKSQIGVSVSFSSDGRFILRTIAGVASLWGVPISSLPVLPSPTPIFLGKGTTWEFDSEDDNEGWRAWNQVSFLYVNQGSLNGMSTGNDPSIGSPVFAIDAKSNPIINIRMNVSAGDSAQLFFITSSDKNYDETKSLRFTVSGDSNFHTYVLDMSTISGWKGTITQIRLDPIETQGTFQVDYIRIMEH
jgi:WD40 repeat protein